MEYLWLLGVFVAALVGAFIIAAPIAGLALQISLLVILPLTIVVAGLFAALCAKWVGDWLAPEGLRRRLARVVGLTEIAAAVLAILFLALIFWLESLTGSLSPNVLLTILIGSAVVLSVAATLATWRSPDPEPDLGRDVLATLGLIGVAAFVVLWAQAVAPFLSLLGI